MNRSPIVKIAAWLVIVFAAYSFLVAVNEIIHPLEGEAMWRSSGKFFDDLTTNPVIVNPICAGFSLFVVMTALNILREKSRALSTMVVCLCIYSAIALLNGIASVSALGGLADMGKLKIHPGADIEFNQLILNPLNNLKKQVLWKMGVQLAIALSLLGVFFLGRVGGWPPNKSLKPTPPSGGAA